MADQTQTIKVIYEATQAQKDAAKFATDEQKRTRETAAEAKKAARETAAAQTKADRERRDSNNAVNALLKEHSRDETRTAQTATAAKTRSVKDGLRQEMIAFKEKHQLVMMEWAAEQKAAAATAAAQRQTTAATQAGAASMAGMVTSMIGVTSAAAGLGVIKEVWKGIADEAARAAAAAYGFHQQERVSGTLVGKTAEEISPEILKLMTTSGLPQQQADEFFRQFEGSLPAGLQKGNISRQVANELMRASAVTAARQGGDAGTRGDLAGILAMFAKVESSRAGLGQLEAIRQALTEGRGDDTPLTRSLLNVAGTLVREGGPVGSLSEMAALVGTTSLTSGPMMADTRALQIMRATRGTEKTQMGKIQEEFGIPVGSKMSLEQRLDKMVPKLREIGKSEDIASWLTTHIGTPQEDSEAMVQIVGNYDVLKQRFAAARAGALGGMEVEKANRAFLDSDLGRQMTGQVKGLAGEYLVGRKLQGANAMVEAVKAVHAAQPPAAAKGIEEILSRATTLGGYGRAEYAAEEMLHQEVRRAGLEDKLPAWRFGRSPLETIQGEIDVLRGAGIDPMASVNDALKKTIEQPMDELIKINQKHFDEVQKHNAFVKAQAAPPMVPPPAMPAKPAPMVRAPGG